MSSDVGDAFKFCVKSVLEPDYLWDKLTKGNDDDVIVGEGAHDGRAPCATCGSRRTLGDPGHEIPCPLCSPHVEAPR